MKDKNYILTLICVFLISFLIGSLITQKYLKDNNKKYLPGKENIKAKIKEV